MVNENLNLTLIILRMILILVDLLISDGTYCTSIFDFWYLGRNQ